MVTFIMAKLGFLFYSLAIFLMTIASRKEIIPVEPDPGGGHDHLHVADGEGNPGLPLRTGSDGRLIVREVAVRNTTAKLSFEHGAGEAASVQAASGALELHSSGGYIKITSGGDFGFNVASPGGAMEISLSTANLTITDAGTAGATEAGWVAVKIGGSTMYLRAFATV